MQRRPNILYTAVLRLLACATKYMLTSFVKAFHECSNVTTNVQQLCDEVKHAVLWINCTCLVGYRCQTVLCFPQAIQILIGLFSIGIGTIILLSHPYYNEFTVYGVPIWLGVLVRHKRMDIL